jgi:hypothetical protein
MILYLVKYCVSVSSVVKLEVYDVRVRSVSDSLKILCVNSEENVLHTVTVDVARNLSCSTNCLYGCLVARLANLAIEFNVLHCFFVLKCVTQFLVSRNPIAPKSSLLFRGGKGRKNISI